MAATTVAIRIAHGNMPRMTARAETGMSSHIMHGNVAATGAREDALEVTGTPIVLFESGGYVLLYRRL